MRRSLAPARSHPERSDVTTAPYARPSQLDGAVGREGTGGVTMSINRTRGSLYKLARILGDVQAVRRGRVGRRVGRRVAGKFLGRGMGRLFR